jgi:uncharacterized protein involved in exopolysaccharide biosynthesis
MYQSGGPGLRCGVNRYLATFSRHKIGLVLPVVLALAISSWYAMGRPHKYESYMSVWFDTPVPGASSLVDPQNNNLTPSAQGQQTLQELLGTKQFLIDVGQSGRLGTYFHSQGPASGVDGEIVAALTNKFSLTVVGPQVLRVAMTSTNPEYMQGSLSGVATAYVDQVTGTLQARDQASVAYDQTQVKGSYTAAQQANEAVYAFQRSHPGQTATNNVELSQLTQSAFQAQETYNTNLTTLEQAQISLQNVAAPTAFHVVDAPSAPVRLSSKKHMIFTIVAGLAAGLVVSILALSALTSLDKTARVPGDIETMLGMNVVGSIEEARRPRIALPRRSGSR